MSKARKTRKYNGEIYKKYMGFESKTEAKQMRDKLKKRGFKARVVPGMLNGKKFYRIYRKRK